ncbi:R3H domain protein [bacterium BMS3Abin02]|nr:R3H domain protein [bacterium BMS3Abin02]
MEWVEVRGPTVELAVQAAVEELGLTSPDQANVEVLQNAERGFLGLGRKDAVVRVQAKPKRRRRRPKNTKRGDQRVQKPEPKGEAGRPRQKKKPQKEQKRQESSGEEGKKVREEQAEVVGSFLRGLLEAFGLEGEVTTRVEDDIIYADVAGSQAEALIGPHGSVLQAVHELCKTVIQRKTRESARIRLDIGGYQERRKEALRIYARRLAEQVIEEQSEIMLEPMNAAERKVIHDAVADIEGVQTYSEGEEPRRSVVLSPKD